MLPRPNVYYIFQKHDMMDMDMVDMDMGMVDMGMVDMDMVLRSIFKGSLV